MENTATQTTKIKTEQLTYQLKFETQLSGRKDLVRNGGTVRGKHKVRITLQTNANHGEICKADLLKLQSMDEESLRTKISSELSFSDQEWEDALRGTAKRKKGIITSFTETLDPNTIKKESPYIKDDEVNGVLMHKDTGDVYVRGLLINQEIIEADPNGNARKTKSGTHVLIKNAIAKELDLQSCKWRTYKINEDIYTNFIK